MSFVADPFDAGSDVGTRERRLHMIAYDYWEGLRAGRIVPDFRDLTPDGLQPFRDSSLLIDVFNDAEAVGDALGSVRFAGSGIAGLIAEDKVSRGMAMGSLALSPFGTALMTYLAEQQGEQRPTEFNYRDEQLAGRGILLPLSLGEQTPSFVWIVTSFSAREERSRAAVAADGFDTALGDARDQAAAVPHMDVGGRQALYGALASALRIYEDSQSAPHLLEQRLQIEGIRHQKRAPFTPILKLVFGKDYEKTRLTEYAAALSFAVRQGYSSETLEAFLVDFPGGIKGCVKAERAAKAAEARGEGLATPDLDASASSKLLADADGPRVTLALDEEFTLLLARKDGDDAVILGPSQQPKAILERALIKRARDLVQNTSPERSSERDPS